MCIAVMQSAYGHMVIQSWNCIRQHGHLLGLLPPRYSCVKWSGLFIVNITFFLVFYFVYIEEEYQQ